jgi:excinuclease ABC subunit B
MSTTIVADSKGKVDYKKKKKDSDKLTLHNIIEPLFKKITDEQRKELIEQLRTEMKTAAKDLEFERAAELRDEISRLDSEG